MSARSRTSRLQGRRPAGRAEYGPAEQVERGRTEHEADEQLAEHRRLAEPAAGCTRELRGCDDDAEQEEELQQVGHGRSAACYRKPSGR